MEKNDKKCWCGGQLQNSVHPMYGQCVNCGTLVLKNLPSPEELKNFYSFDNYWHDYMTKVSQYPPIEDRAKADFENRIPAWYDLVKKNKTKVESLLEIGCAHGGFLFYCLQNGVKNVVGVEPDEQTCEFARKTFNLPHIVKGLFPEVELPLKKFDVIAGFDVAEHFVEPIRAFKEVANLLNDDGIFIFQTPCYYGEDHKWMQFRPDEHIYLYNKNSIKKLFEASGLEIKKILPGYFPDDIFVMGSRKEVCNKNCPGLDSDSGKFFEIAQTSQIQNLNSLNKHVNHAEQAKKVLIVRTDSIGDFVIFSGILPYLRQLYKDAEITILLQGHIAEMAEHCPYVDKVVTIDRKKFIGDTNYSEKIIAELKQQNYDVAIYPVYSRDSISDYITLNSGAKTTITSYGDKSNITDDEKLKNDRLYTKLLPASTLLMIETSRNEEILRGLGINPDTNYKTQVWITEQDRSTAKKILDDLQVERPIVVCPFGQYEIRNWPINKWARLLDNYRDNPIVICGIAENKRKAEQIISLTGHSNIHNLCGQTTLRELAALLERAAACVCVESAAGHIAAAVGCPQTVITGGGHFGRFLPYSPTTTMVYMPMDCFNCNWICTFQEKEVYCISQIKVETVDRAVRKVMQTSRQSFTRPELIEQKTEFLRPAEPKQDSSKYLITAIVSTYNSEKHIAGCLEDLESQTIADKVEIIVVDSSSRQNERAIVQEFQKRYSNIKYIRTENRETVYKAWNRAIAAATGKYITNANTDDRHRKDALEVMADTLDKNPDIAVVYSDQQWVDDKGAVVNEFAAPEHSRWILLFDKCYVSSNPMWRKTIHQSCGLFDEDLFFVSGDREFWLRVSQKYNFLHIPQMLGIRRFTPDCISRINVEQRDGCDHLEASLITKCYHHALETGQQIDNKGISGNPMFNSWPEVKLLREKLKAKLQDKKINPADYISQTIDCRKSQTHKLSIVIDSFNQKDSLINNLSNLNNQSEKDFEVIVVNRGDELAELRQTCDIKYDLCCVNLKENLGSSFGRNIGISMAKAEYVAFLDQDSVAHPDFVKNIYEGFKKYEIYGLRGKILPLNSKFSALCPDYYDIGDQVIYTACETVTNCAFRKDVLTRVGGFDEDLFAYQAQELSYKIYMLEGEKVDRISYLPEIIVYHDYIKDIADWSQKALDNKAGKMAATRKWLWQKYNLGLDSYLELMRSNYPASRNKQTADFKKLLNIAIILQENNPELAVQWAQKAIAANPSVGKGYYLLGSLYFNLARYAEAEAMLEKTLDLLVPAIIAKPAMRSERELEVYQGSQSCYLSACTKLAHCYMLSGDLKKLKGIYTHMLTNHHLEMPGELRSQIKGLLDKLKENESVTANKISTSSSGQLFNEPQKIQNRQELNVSPNPAESKYTVSAIVSVYNCRKFIRRCLEDLENQTIADKLEIIVVNSGSQENEEQIVKEFQQKYNNIKYIKTEHREGIYRAWNRAVAAARGRYLTSANTDDRHRKDALEIMAKALDAEPDVALVYGDQIYTDTPNPTFENHHVVEMNRRPEFSRQSLLFECYIGSQPMWRKSLHDELGGFDETLIRASDWDFWLRIAGKYKLKHIPEFLGLFYLNENAVGFRRTIHRLYERYLVGRRYGNPYISAIPLYGARGNPLVSIVMAAYNAADYIARAIESVLIQNYRNFELIIVDDGSTDQTADVVRSFKDEPIKYFFKEYGGSASARNFALKKSSGSFIVMLDSNDMMTPDFISRHLQEFEKKPEADLIYCDDCLIDENDKPIRVINRPEYKDRNLLIRDLFRSGFPVVPFRTCIRKEVFEKIGLYDEQLIIAEDYDMIRRFIKQGLKLGHLPTALYLRRLTAEGLSKSFSERKARSHFEVVRRITETFNYDELFPNVKWEKVAPEKRHLHFRCLVAMTYLAIGQSYIQSNSPLYAQSAIDMAQMEIKQCLKDDPANQRLQQLLYKCQQYQAELAEKKRQMVCQPA